MARNLKIRVYLLPQDNSRYLLQEDKKIYTGKELKEKYPDSRFYELEEISEDEYNKRVDNNEFGSTELDDVYVTGQYNHNKPSIDNPNVAEAAPKRPFDALIERNIAANKPWNEAITREYNKITNPIFGESRVTAYQKAMEENPNFSQNWDTYSNIMEHLNATTGGLLNRLSPTLNTRLLYDWYHGKSVSPFDYGSSYWGNSGIVTDEFAREHPYWTVAINGATDAALTYGLNKFPRFPRFVRGTRLNFSNGRVLFNDIKNHNILGVLENPLTKNFVNSSRGERFFTKTAKGKRALEIFMRSAGPHGDSNPIDLIISSAKRQPYRPKINYVLFGKSPRARKLFHLPMMHYGDNFYGWSAPYTGIYGPPFTIKKGYGDLVDAFLYGKEIDPRIATLSESPTGTTLLKDYIAKNYSDKNIPTYTTKSLLNERIGDYVEDDAVISRDKEWTDKTGSFLARDGEHGINVAGHNILSGITANGDIVTRGVDIWKFNPEDYIERWLKDEKTPNPYAIRGLEFLDKAGTPIIFERPWLKNVDPKFW